MGTTDGASWYYNFEKLPWEDPSEHLRRSPLTYVGNVKTPTMLMTGVNDLRTPMPQTEQFYSALKLRKVPTAMVRFNDEWHGTTTTPSNFMRTSSIFGTGSTSTRGRRWTEDDDERGARGGRAKALRYVRAGNDKQRILALVDGGCAGPDAIARDPARPRRPSPQGGVVCTSAPACDAGASVLAIGGNAVDAAVATAFALAVTHPSAGNIGGGGFMIVRTPNGDVTAFDYREKAPLKSTRTMYLGADGRIDISLTRAGTSRPACRAPSAAWPARTGSSGSCRGRTS